MTSNRSELPRKDLEFDPDAPGYGSGIYGLPSDPESAEVILVPVPWEATASYGTGTARGPASILAASQQVDLFDVETGRPYAGGITMLEIPDEIERSSSECRTSMERLQPLLAEPERSRSDAIRDEIASIRRAIDDAGAAVNDWVESQTVQWRDRGRLVGVVGGDHSVPLGAIRSIAKEHPGIGILHIDAHADLREAYMGLRFSHASIFDNVLREAPGMTRLTQVGIRDLGEAEIERIETDSRIIAFSDAALQTRLGDGEPWGAIAKEIVSTLPDTLYVSVDIDGLDPALCPNTGTPVPGGLQFAQLTRLLKEVVDSKRRIIGFDLCEVSPGTDDSSEWDANVGARVLYKLIGFALLSRPKTGD